MAALGSVLVPSPWLWPAPGATVPTSAVCDGTSGSAPAPLGNQRDPPGIPQEVLGRNVPFYPRSVYPFSFLPFSHPSCFQPDLPAQLCLFSAPSPALFVQFSPKLPVNFPPRSEPSFHFGRGRGTRLWFLSLHLFLPARTEVVGLRAGGSAMPPPPMGPPWPRFAESSYCSAAARGAFALEPLG